MLQAHSHMLSFTRHLGLLHAAMAERSNRDTVQPAKLKTGPLKETLATP